MEGFQKNEIPWFLIKTYRLVDDSDTDDIISWSKSNKSFVVWSPITFAEELLPKHFKHNNFSSFIRQLNMYGFRKTDPDRFEFAHEKFPRGQPHLMKEIARSKYESRQHSQQPLGTQQDTGSQNSSVKMENFAGLKEETERFKLDKNILLKEVVKLRQQQQANQRIMQVTVERLRRSEQLGQQMMSFLAKDVESQDVLAQLVRQRGALTRQEISNSSSEQSGSKAQIVKYQNNCNDIVRPKLLALQPPTFSDQAISSEGTIGSGDHELMNFDPIPPENVLLSTLQESLVVRKHELMDIGPGPPDNVLLSTVQENPYLDSTRFLPNEEVHEQSPEAGLIARATLLCKRD